MCTRITLMCTLHVPPFSGEEMRLGDAAFLPLATETRRPRRDSRFSPRLLRINKKSTGAFLSVWTRVSGMSNRGLLRVGPTRFVARQLFVSHADASVETRSTSAYARPSLFSYRHRFIVHVTRNLCLFSFYAWWSVLAILITYRYFIRDQFAYSLIV